MARILLSVLVLAGAASCRHVHPWERTQLAHPTMTTTGQAGPAEEHVHSVHEGATGGGGSVESGCGCN